MSTPGTRLSEVREAKLLSQAKVAQSIGMSASQYNKYEKDKNNFTMGFRIKLSNIFTDKELDYIQYGNNIPMAHSIVQSGSNGVQQVGNNNSNNGEVLSADEKTLLDFFRKADEKTKAEILVYVVQKSMRQ